MHEGLKLVAKILLRSRGSRHAFLTPLMWTASACWAAAYIFGLEKPLQWICPWFAFSGLLIAGLAVAMFIVLWILLPERLRSEPYQLQLKALEFLKEQGEAKNLKPSYLESVMDVVLGPYREKSRDDE